jgi:hypothetical protein
MTRTSLLAVILAAAVVPGTIAQTTRPIPYPVFYSQSFEQAIARGTRSETGAPGPQYWTNTAEYVIEATLSPATNMLRGTETVTYFNNSPDTLRYVLVNLYQNLHSEGVVRTRSVQVTGGVHVTRVTFDGRDVIEGPYPVTFGRFGQWPTSRQYAINGTKLRIDVPEGIAPGTSATMGFAWSFEVPEVGAPRMGQDGEVYYLAYWYPQLAVYDDVRGWDIDPYQGAGEFYMGYADYDVSITVPHGWLIGATGELVNDGEVLSSTVRKRLAQAAVDPDVVRVVTADDRKAGASTTLSPTGSLTWHFRAKNVRDFAFGTSDKYLWDATHAVVGDLNGDGTTQTSMIHAFYRPDAETWDRSAEFSKFSIEHLSRNIMPYPYPHMTAVQGIIGGGMEFPMITLIGGGRNAQRLFGVTYHELGHMWFPMLVGQDEKSFTWMDEGLTSFVTAEGGSEFWQTEQWPGQQESYLSTVRSGIEEPSMRHGDKYLSQWARGTASYAKPSSVMHALRGVLGNNLFYHALREYARRWTNRHPMPWDLFNTFEDVVGEDLDWFWTPWFYETWALDQAVSSVVNGADGTVEVTVTDLGLVPMPAPVQVTYADGRIEVEVVPVEYWLADHRKATLSFPAGTVKSVVVDAGGFYPDLDRENNVWEAHSQSSR